MGWLAGAVVAITFLARIYIGDHWLSDAAGGLALGLAVGSAGALWLLGLSPGRSRDRVSN